jgi:hypothetical protein
LALLKLLSTASAKEFSWKHNNAIILFLSYTCPQKDKGTKFFNQIARFFFQIFAKFGLFIQTLIKVYKVKFHKNSSSGSQVYTRGQRETGWPKEASRRFLVNVRKTPY